MKKVLAIIGLTWKSAFRYRLFWVMLALLVAAVGGLPLILKDDGTAKGLTQIVLTYTVSAVATLLGFATLWLSCGTLAKDIEECQMQVLSVKPISRWQIWLGKWLGIISLDAVLLGLAGAGVFFLLQWRAERLPQAEQQILRREIFVSRAAAREPPRDLTPDIEAEIKRRVGKNQYSDAAMTEIRHQAAEYVTSQYTEVPPAEMRFWCIDLHSIADKIQGKPLQIRVKFHTGDQNTERQYNTAWIIGPTNAPGAFLMQEKLPQDSFQELQLPPDKVKLDDQGRLWVQFVNGTFVPTETGVDLIPNPASVVFPLGEGFELLYPESTFAVNFVRGLMILLFWLALLASIGLACASYLTFPVASFVSLALLFLGLSSGTISTVVTNGTITGYDSAKASYGHSPADIIMIPVFEGLLKIINLVESFSPVDALSSGESITWGQLGLAFTQIVVVLGGLFCIIGIILFGRRELATAQGNN